MGQRNSFINWQDTFPVISSSGIIKSHCFNLMSIYLILPEYILDSTTEVDMSNTIFVQLLKNEI